MTKITSSILLLRNRMLYALSNSRTTKLQTIQVRSLISRLSFWFPNHRTFSTTHLTGPSPFSPSTDQSSKTHIDLYSINCSGIAKSVLLRCPTLLEKVKGQNPIDAPLKDLLLEVSDVIPDIARRFRRALCLKAEDMLEILLSYEFESRNGIEGLKVESLWKIFSWANEQNVGFKHIPRSCEVMASLLVRVGMLREVELLLEIMQSKSIPLDGDGIFSDLIEGLVGAGELERALLVYRGMMDRGSAPSLSCYRILLDSLVRMKKSQLAFRVCLDMVKGFCLGNLEKGTFATVVRLLCTDGKIKEARNLVKKVVTLGLKPSGPVLDDIGCGCCEKRDFEDLLNFFHEMKHSPSIEAGNKILQTICSNFGAERAYMFSQELERLGFMPNEITFGILIGGSCREGNLKSALFYLSEILSRSLKPDIRSYTSLISGFFKSSMWKHARDILDEMKDTEVTPNLSFFRVLLAGYCKFRQFAEAKSAIGEMVNCGLIQLSSHEDPLSKAFSVLGLSSLDVKVKRDNDVGVSRTEFFDDIGNGLYLDTDLDQYEKIIDKVLEESLVPDFNSLVIRECGHGNLKAAFMLVDEMVLWGQELTTTVFSQLVKELGVSCFHVKAISNLQEKMPKLANHLDKDTLNLLVQAYSRKGLTLKGKMLLDGMLKRHITITSETYTAIIMGLCKKRNLKDLQFYWRFAKKDKWLPAVEDFRGLVVNLCLQNMIKEALELFENMLVSFPQMRVEICNTFLEKFCAMDFTSIAHICMTEILHQTDRLDNIVYNHLIRGFCKENNFLEASRLFDVMQSKNLFPSTDVCVPLIRQLCKAGKFETAIALKDACLTDQASGSLLVHSALIKGFCKTGKVMEAAKLFSHMLSTDPLPDAEIYNMLIQGQCRASNSRKVWELLGVMIRKNLSLSVSSYRDLVHLMCVESRVLLAVNMRNLMHGLNKSHGLVLSNILIFYLFQAGSILLVNEVLGDLQEKGLVLDEVSYNFLVYGFAMGKDISNSLHYLNAMISKGLKPHNRCLRTVVTCLCDIGELGKALNLSQQMESRRWIHGSIIQNAVVETLLSHGKLEEAEKFVDRMMEKRLIPDNVNYDNLIKHFCSYGRMNKAVELVNMMLKKGNVPNSSSYDSVISGLCKCNKLDQALDFHTEMMDKHLKPSANTWGVLINSISRDGQTSKADRLLQSMIRLGETPTKEVFCSVINRFRSENNLEKVSELVQRMQQCGHEPDFETHWSLIRNLNNLNGKDYSSTSNGYLSKLLSGSRFAA